MKNLENHPNNSYLFLQNVLWMVWSGVVSIANSVLVWVFMARWREADEIGRFTIVMSLYMLFFTFCSLGLMPYIVHEISRRRSENSVNEFISTASISLLAWGFICALLMAVSGFLVSSSAEIWISTAILCLAMIPTGAINTAEAVSLAFGKTRLIALVTTLENLLRTIIPIFLIWFGFGLPWICASFVLVRFVSLGVYFAANYKILAVAGFSRDIFRTLLKVTPTFAGITIFASLNWQIVTLLLGRFSTELESAKYGVASRFLIPVMILMSSYAGVIQPLLAIKKGEKFGAFLSNIVQKLLLLATLGSILAPFFSVQVLTILFGEKYADTAPALNILALTVVPFCAVMVAARGLVASDAPHIDLLANAVGVAICLIAGIFLVSRYGATGAALTQFLSFLAMALVEIGYLSGKIINFKIWRVTAFSFSCLLIICAFIWK
jgi:O-antigen/teichoic acid export membrane protein